MFSNPFNSKIVSDITKFLSEHKDDIDIDPCLNEAAKVAADAIDGRTILEDRRSIMQEIFNEAVSECGCRGSTKDANDFAKAVDLHIREGKKSLPPAFLKNIQKKKDAAKKEEVTGNNLAAAKDMLSFSIEESVTRGFARIVIITRDLRKKFVVTFSRDPKDANTILATSEAGTKKINLKEFVEWCDKFDVPVTGPFQSGAKNDKNHYALDYSDGGYDYQFFIGPYWTNKFVGVSMEASYIWMHDSLYPKAYPHPAWRKKVKQLAMGGVR